MFPGCAIRAQETQQPSMMKKHLIHKYTKKTIEALRIKELGMLKIPGASGLRLLKDFHFGKRAEEVNRTAAEFAATETLAKLFSFFENTGAIV